MKTLSFSTKRVIIMCIMVGFCFFLSGCAVLNIPAQIVGGTFKVIGSIAQGLFDLIKKLPKPPPGVF